jgi:hypothetical protein
MKKTVKSRPPVNAETIARKAEHGENVSSYFTNQGRMMPAIRKIDVDFTERVLNELDEVAAELNISRQAMIKTLVREALDRHYLALQARKIG